MINPPALHVPSDPGRERWAERAMERATLDEIIEKEDGIAAWLWERWSVLESAGLDRQRFVAIAAGYRRELWLWLAGERTWAQCCSGLIGRIDRRLTGR